MNPEREIKKPPMDIRQPQVPPEYQQQSIPGYPPPPMYPPQGPYYQPPPPVYYQPPPPLPPPSGGLSYASSSSERKKGGNPIVTILMSVIVGAIVTIALIYQMAPNADSVRKMVTDAVAPATASITAYTAKVDNVLNSLTGYTKTSDLSQYALKTDITGITKPDLSSYYTKAEIDAKFALKGTTAGTGTGVIPPTGAGEISYTIQNPPSFGFFTLNTAQNISIRIFNNKNDTRYIRPQITCTSYQNQSNTLSVCTATILSNTLGQVPVVFVGTPIPGPILYPCTQVLFFSSTGGVMNGQYLLGPGQEMDLLVQITLTQTLGTGLWTIQVGGSDISMVTGY